MLSLRRRLEQQAKTLKTRLDVIQQDYILTWLLHGIASVSALSSSLVFKGGTALKKCYFGDYRFSGDLDFTALDAAPKGPVLGGAMQEVCRDIERALNSYGPMKVVCERYHEKQRHPHGQEAFIIRTQFPWQREPLTCVMVEVTYSETLVCPPCTRQLLHAYEEPELGGSIVVYSLDEIILEKLRAVLQQTKKLHERTWSRSRARDYYDLWHILCRREHQIQTPDFHERLVQKCTPKEMVFEGPEDFFSPVMVSSVIKTWERWVGSLVAELPPVEGVIAELRKAIEGLFSLEQFP